MINDKKWYDETWNPVTGVIGGFQVEGAEMYCRRFCGDIRANLAKSKAKEITPNHFELTSPYESTRSNHYISCPFGTLPTFHKYRMYGEKTPYSWKKGRVINVCAFTDIYEEGMPVDWRYQVESVMSEVPQHQYIVTTRYPAFIDLPNVIMRYTIDQLSDMDELLKLISGFGDRKFILNIPVIKKEALDLVLQKKYEFIFRKAMFATFNSKNKDSCLVSCLTKNLDSYSTPYIDEGNIQNTKNYIPTFEVSNVFNKLTSDTCAICKSRKLKSEMHTIGHYIKRGEGYKKIGYICDECFEEFIKTFE